MSLPIFMWEDFSICTSPPDNDPSERLLSVLGVNWYKRTAATIERQAPSVRQPQVMPGSPVATVSLATLRIWWSVGATTGLRHGPIADCYMKQRPSGLTSIGTAYSGLLAFSPIVTSVGALGFPCVLSQASLRQPSKDRVEVHKWPHPEFELTQETLPFTQMTRAQGTFVTELFMPVSCRIQLVN